MYYRKDNKVVSSIENFEIDQCPGISAVCITSIFILLIMILFPIFFKQIQEIVLKNKFTIGGYGFILLLLFITIIYKC
jgi:hypothetical protein